MTWAWLLATLACLPLCYRGDSRFLKVCLVLLLGPGALPICSSLHTKDERERAALSLCLLPLTLLAGSSCLLWLLNRALLIDYCEFFQTLSLALPAPAHLLQALNRLVSDPGISLAWLLGNLLLPIWLWRWLCSRHSFAPLASLWLQIDELRRQPGNSVAVRGYRFSLVWKVRPPWS